MHNTNCNEQVKERTTKSDDGFQHKTGWNLLAVKWPAKLINAPSELRWYTVIAQECNVNLKQMKNSNSEKKALFWKGVLIWNNSEVENQKQRYFWHLIRPHPCPECALLQTSKGTAFSVFSAYTLLSKSVTSQVPHPLARLGRALYLWQTTVGNWAIYCVPRMAFETLVISKGSSVNILESCLHYAAVYTRM